jgi:dihydroorotate dehydrogenase (NAD+) catalytic subunit
VKARKRVVTALDRAATLPAARRQSRPPAAPRAAQRSGLTTGPARTGARAGPPGAPANAEAAASPSDAQLDLSVDLGRGLLLRNPLVVASGAMGFGVELDGLIEPERLGAVCTRGITLRARPGNPPPRMARTPGGLLNGVGPHNPGIDAVLDRYAESWARWPVPVILNLAAGSPADFAELARRLEGVPGVAGIELNLSCPNTARGGTPFALEAEAAGNVIAAVRRATDLPLIAKLSPAAPDARAVARAVADAGADAISAVNTLPAFALDRARSGPALGAGYGGLSGPALRPIALRVVHEIASAVAVPIVAMGGITSLADVLDFLAVGAAAVGVASAAIGEPQLPGRLADELADDCRRRGLASHRPLVGTALAPRSAPTSSRAAEYRP